MPYRLPRKNSRSTLPPDAGGFRVIRAPALIAALFLALLSALFVAPASSQYGVARAQASPPKTDSTDELVRQVVTLDSEINSVKGKMSELENRSVELGRRIKSLGPEIEQRRARVSSRRSILAARARSLYVNGRTSKLVVLVTSSDVSDFFNRNDMLEKVARRDAEMIKSTRAEAATLQSSMSELKKSKSDVDAAGAQLRSQQKRLESSRSEKQSVISSAGPNSSEVIARSGTVENKMNEINRERPAPAPMAPVNGRPSGRVMMMVATAYCPLEPGLDDHTASGMRATRGVIAVDPRVIPLGTRLNVEGYGNCIAGDTGSAIKGNRIDLCFDTLEEMDAFGGYRTLRVEILD